MSSTHTDGQADEQAADLRQRAEERWHLRGEEPAEQGLPAPERPVVQELRVHQIELEMQNEELRRAQQELEQSRDKYFDMYDLAPVGYLTLSEQGLILGANLTLATLLGVERGHLSKLPLTRFIVAEDQDIFYQQRRRLAQTGMRQACEVRMVRRDAAPFWACIETIVTPDAAGGLPSYWATVSDISERKQLELEQARLAALVESSADAIIGVDLDGRVVSWNWGAETLYGYAKAEAIGHLFPALVAPSQLEDFLQILDFIGRGAVVQQSEVTQKTKNGRSIDVVFAVSPIRAADGQITGASWIARDMTDRKRIQDALHQSEARYRMLADNVDDVIWVMDTQQRFTYFSPSVERLSGYTPEESMRQTLDEMLAPASARVAKEQMGEIWAAAMAAGAPAAFKRLELEQRRRDGRTVWIEVGSAPLYDEAGAFAGVIGVSRDITQRRAMEQEIRSLNATLEQQVEERTTQLAVAVANLKRAARIKDEFMATVSHELRTPLAGVLALAEVLETQGGGQLNERQVSYVQGIYQSGKRLLSMVDSMLRYSRLMAGDVQFEHEPCALAELCTTAVRAARIHATQKGQTIAVSVEPADLAIVSDAQSIIITLQHLLDNAVKFTPAGGRIGLEVHGDGTSVRLLVWDTGIGIAAEQQEYIFQPFVQGDNSLARHFQGAGLGLAYVQRVVALLGGAITLESTPGVGSRFTVTLPTTPSHG